MKLLALCLLLPVAASAGNFWKRGDFIDREGSVWSLQGPKPRSLERPTVKTDPDGTSWYKDKEGQLFFLDPELLVPIYQGRHGLHRKAEKEVAYGYDFLCRERERHRYGGTPFLSEYSAATLKYPIHAYYEDVDRLLANRRMRGCPSLKDEKFEAFLDELNTVCVSGCGSMAKGHQRPGDFELESYPKHREEEQAAECRKICGRTHVKELNALQNYRAQNLLKFLEPVGAGKKGGFEIEEYRALP